MRAETPPSCLMWDTAMSDPWAASCPSRPPHTPYRLGSASSPPLPARKCLDETTEPLLRTHFCPLYPALPAAIPHLPPHQHNLLLLLPSSWKPEAGTPLPRLTAPQQRRLSQCRWDGVVPRSPCTIWGGECWGWPKVLGGCPGLGGSPRPPSLPPPSRGQGSRAPLGDRAKVD